MIKPLNTHYSFENPASVYDEEALTALELAGRQGKKINEVVGDQNALRQETEEHLENQDETIEKRMTSQDNRITIMNDVTMPGKVKEEFKNNLDNGTFEIMVDEYAGELTTRLNHLLGQVVAGSTSLDAEIIDMRLDADGKIHAAAGAGVRENFSKLNTLSKSIESTLFSGMYPDFSTATAIDIVNEEGYTLERNGLKVETDTVYSVSQMIPTAPGDIHYIEGCFYRQDDLLANPIACFYDINGDFVKDVIVSGEAGLNRHNGIIVTPPGASTFMITGRANMPIYCCKVKNVFFKDKDATDFVQKITPYILTGDYEDGENLATDLQEGYLLSWAGAMTVIDDKQWCVSQPFNVKEGVGYHVKCYGGWNNMCYKIMNSAGKILLKKQYPTSATTIDEYIMMPMGASTMVLSGSNLKDLYVKEITGINNISKPWAGKKWVVVGDSLTENNIRATKNYHGYVSDETGITVVNMGLSGSGYRRKYDTNQAFYQRVLNVPTDADVITIFGSFNDMNAGEVGTATDTGTETLAGAINTTLDNIFATYPLARVGIVTPTPWQGTKPSTNAKADAYVDVMMEICKLRGIPYLDLFHTSGLRPWEESYRALCYSRDDGGGTHPDETGHKLIAPRFREFIATLL